MTKQKLYLGLDQGSSSTKACLVNDRGEVIYNDSKSVTLKKIDSLTHQQSCDELFQSVRHVYENAKAFCLNSNYAIEAIGLACQRSGVCCWNRAGDRLHDLIPWSDLRMSSKLQLLVSKQPSITSLSGLPLNAHYAAGKIAYLQEMFQENDALIGTLDSYLFYRLSGHSRFVTEDSMASRTQLYSLESGTWDKLLGECFNVEVARLPMIASSVGEFGLLERTPITAMLGDQQAALYSIYLSGRKAILNLGSIASLAVVTDEDVVREKGFLSAVFYSAGKHKRERKFLIEAITSSCGAVIQYILTNFPKASDIESINAICSITDLDEESIALYAPNGTATPDWKDFIELLTFNCDSTDAMIKALVENIGNFIIRNIEKLKAAVPAAFADEKLVVSGGVSEISYLLQYIADCTGLTLIKLNLPQATAIGVALAAGGVKEIKLEVASDFKPRSDSSRKRYSRWLEVYLSRC